MGVFDSAGAAPSGAPFVIYHDVIDETTSGRIEIAIPVDGAFQPTDRVTLKEMPGGLAASTIHKEPTSRYHPPTTHSLSG